MAVKSLVEVAMFLLILETAAPAPTLDHLKAGMKLLATTAAMTGTVSNLFFSLKDYWFADLHVASLENRQMDFVYKAGS